MKCQINPILLLGTACIVLLLLFGGVWAADDAQNTDSGSLKLKEETEQKLLKLEEVRVTAPRQDEDIVVSPSTTTINVEEYKTTGTAKNVVDILKDRAIIDFRGQSDLVPEEDDVYMRGFDAHRFTTAMDGMTIDYGRSAASGTRTMVVDFATLPIGQIESVEIMPGPHSALYGGKSMGGVINLKTKRPEKYTILKPDCRVTTSYGSYNTQNHSVSIDGGAGSFVYGLSYQHYRTDGYLRHNSTEIDNYSARFGYILPLDGYISFNVAYTDKDKEDVAKNEVGGVDYDSDYPETTTTTNYGWNDRKQDIYEYTYRLNYEQPSRIGLWNIGAYYGNQDWENSYFREKDTGKRPEVEPDEIELYSSGTRRNRQVGVKIQDEIGFSEDNTVTVGFDRVQMWQEPEYYYYEDTMYQKEKHDIYYCNAGYLQDKWTIIPRLTLTAGLRYEDVSYWRSNWNSSANTTYITGKGRWVRRDSNQWIPKSFLTYDFDGLAEVLSDTSVSIGASKIWNPTPFCYG
jgi:outer membrane cobalamin receptor